MVRCTLDLSFEYNVVHGYYSIFDLDNRFYLDNGDFIPNTDTWLFIDMPERVVDMSDEVLLAKSEGVKIVLLFYDEIRFPIVDYLIDVGLIDKIILFDKKYQYRFPIETYISDYYVNEKAFPMNITKKYYDRCYFGSILADRIKPGLKYIRTKHFDKLYRFVSEYKNAYAPSATDCNGDIIHYNKGKFIEYLFCRMNVECGEGIKTINYENYKSIDIDDRLFEEIRVINKSVIEKLIKEI